MFEQWAIKSQIASTSKRLLCFFQLYNRNTIFAEVQFFISKKYRLAIAVYYSFKSNSKSEYAGLLKPLWIKFENP